MSKSLAIYFSDPEPMGYPLNKSVYLEIYKEIIQEIESHGIEVYIVRADGYLQNGLFKRAWRFIDNELKEVEGEIKVDLIFNRDDKNTIPNIEDCKIINQSEFDEICTDKLKTFKHFPKISPKTAEINSYEECMQMLEEWQIDDHDLIVLKKNFETEGRGIHILPANEITKELYEDWTHLMMQEFVDSSIGIPGITKGLHDLRITVINGEAINSFLRTPKDGSYLANVSQGGTGTSIDLEQIPKEVFELVDEIDQHFEKYKPTIYAADFINSPKGYKLIELNSRPGVQHPNWSESYKKFNHAIVKMLVEAVQS